MAKTTKEFPGFPKFYFKGEVNRVANTPADAVNLETRGFEQRETKAAAKVAEQVSGGSTESATVKATEFKPAAPKTTTAPQGNTRPLAH